MQPEAASRTVPSIPRRLAHVCCGAAFVLGAGIAGTVAFRCAAAPRPPIATIAGATPLPCVARIAALTAHGPGGLRGPATASAGTTITVDVATNDSSVEVTDPVTGETRTQDRGPDGRVRIPVPNRPGPLLVSVGDGRRRHVLVIEVQAPAP